MTNAMECGQGAAVFEVAARFNHSCVPNAHFAWSEEHGLETVFAVNDICENEVQLYLPKSISPNGSRDFGTLKSSKRVPRIFLGQIPC
jgi:hypothetical protein